MGGFFDKALKRLNSTPVATVADTLTFETVDAALLARQLKLQDQGIDRGRQNEPATESAGLDSIEHTIIRELDEYRRKAVEHATRSLQAYSARLHALDFENARVDILAAIEVAKSNFIAEVHQGANELYQKRRSVIEATEDVDRFKQTHRLPRQAHLPDSKIWIWGFLALLLVIEALGNSALFAGGLFGGFLEAVVVALGIAVLNVMVGFLIGLYVVRFLLYRNVFIKFAAFTGLLFDLAFATLINLGVGRFRSALDSADPEVALAAAFNVSPLVAFQQFGEISGFQSYLLITLGILFHIAAMFDGFKFDDPYPFYGKYWRKREEAEVDYAEMKEHLIEFLTAERDRTIEEMQNTSRHLTSAHRVAARIRENRLQTYQRFKVYIESVEGIANQLLAIYREANITARSFEAPSHFGQAWSFPSHDILGEPAGEEGVTHNDDIATTTQKDLEEGITQINSSYVNAVTTYAKIESMFAKEIFDAQSQQNTIA